MHSLSLSLSREPRTLSLTHAPRLQKRAEFVDSVCRTRRYRLGEVETSLDTLLFKLEGLGSSDGGSGVKDDLRRLNGKLEELRQSAADQVEDDAVLFESRVV